MTTYARSLYHPGHAITAIASGAITAGTFVKVAGGPTSDGPIEVATCGAGEAAIGVAMVTAADTEEVQVHRAGVIEVTVGTGGVTAGTTLEVESDASGNAIALSAGKPLGRVMSTATATNDALIALTIG